MAIPLEIECDLQCNQVEAEGRSATSEVEENPQPTFGLHPDVRSNYSFEDEVQCLPFKFNLGDAPFNKEQQDQLLNLIYDYKEVVSLHNEDLGFCDKLVHTITTTSDKPVHLPYRTIPKQLQGEVRKCLNTWLRQGIICPSKSPYASQVMIVRKKTGKIWL